MHCSISAHQHMSISAYDDDTGSDLASHTIAITITITITISFFPALSLSLSVCRFSLVLILICVVMLVWGGPCMVLLSSVVEITLSFRVLTSKVRAMPSSHSSVSQATHQGLKRLKYTTIYYVLFTSVVIPVGAYIMWSSSDSSIEFDLHGPAGFERSGYVQIVASYIK